jgi:hypothetical protein
MVVLSLSQKTDEVHAVGSGTPPSRGEQMSIFAAGAAILLAAAAAVGAVLLKITIKEIQRSHRPPVPPPTPSPEQKKREQAEQLQHI